MMFARELGLHLRRAQRRQAHSHNVQAHSSHFQPGDEVMLHSPSTPPSRSTKFRRPWSGPYNVVQALYTLRSPTTLNARPTAVHFNWLKPYTTRRPTPLAPSDESLDAADEVEVPAHGGLTYNTCQR